MCQRVLLIFMKIRFEKQVSEVRKKVKTKVWSLDMGTKIIIFLNAVSRNRALFFSGKRQQTRKR